VFEELAPAFTADFGSPVIFKRTGATTTALFDQPDREVLAGRAQSRAYSIEYPASDLVGLVRGDTVLIGIGPGWGFDASGFRLKYSGKNSESADSGEFRVIAPPDLLDDGLFMHADLERL
jgi:hypothetical protein